MDTSGSPPPDRQGLEHTDTEEEETVELVDSHVPSTSTRAEQVCTYACIDVSMLRLTCMCMHVFEGRDENTCVCVRVLDRTQWKRKNGSQLVLQAWHDLNIQVIT